MSDLREVTASREVEAIREDIAQLREDLKGLVSKVGAISSDLAGGLGTQAGRTLSEAKEKAMDVAGRSYERASKEAQRYAETVERSMTEHPFGTAVIALAIGMIMAKLLDRPSSRH